MKFTSIPLTRISKLRIGAYKRGIPTTRCKNGGKDAYIDRFRMLYCLEVSMDVVFLRSKDIYSIL